MQTTINNELAFGFPGEHANGQPWRADPYIASTEVTFGTLAGIDASGKVGQMGASYGTFLGLIVSPHQHVRMILPDDTRSLSVPAGTTIAVAKRGAWYVKVADSETWAEGDKLKVANYKLSKSSSTSDVIVADVLKVKDGVALITLG